MFFKYERLTLFCFFHGELRHNDSFCEDRMALGYEAVEIGWDLSIRAQSRRASTMNSIWLRQPTSGFQSSFSPNNW